MHPLHEGHSLLWLLSPPTGHNVCMRLVDMVSLREHQHCGVVALVCDGSQSRILAGAVSIGLFDLQDCGTSVTIAKQHGLS